MTYAPAGLSIIAHLLPGQRITLHEAEMHSSDCRFAYLYALKQFAYDEFKGNLKPGRKRLTVSEAEELADQYPETFMKFFHKEYDR
jgi:hypothetical protein